MSASTRVRLLLICFCFFVVAPAQAQQKSEPFDRAVAKSNSAYKQAVSYLRTGNIDFALLELNASIDSWRALSSKHQSAPPAVYSDDPRWTDYLSKIAARLARGREQLLSGEMENAMAGLRPVRAVHHEMRRRSNVTLFEDRFFEVSAHMHSMWQYRHITVALANSYSRQQLSDAAISFHAALLASDKIASEELKRNDVYQRLMTKAKSSTPIMIAAIEAGDYDVFLRYLRELRSLEQILYLHFG